MDISVVLCTYNNAERLRITLQSFCRLNQPQGLDWELVTVDNNSTDNTETIIKSFGDRLPIRYVYEPEQGLSRARNAGLEVAEGELIVFTDDDVKPVSDWLVAYWKAYKDRPRGYYFGGPVESEYEGEPPDEDLRRIAMPSVVGLNYGPAPTNLPSDGIFLGANWACPKKYLREAGGFDEGLGLNSKGEGAKVGEETDLMKRLEERNITGWYYPEAKVNHFVEKEKCTIEHIVRRQLEVYGNKENGKVNETLGHPIGLYKEFAKKLVRYKAKKIIKMEWKKDYLECRIWKKRMENHKK